MREHRYHDDSERMRARSTIARYIARKRRRMPELPAIKLELAAQIEAAHDLALDLGIRGAASELVISRIQKMRRAYP